jgi:Rieske Fe-S protein
MVKFLTLGSLLLTSANWITVVAGRMLHGNTYSEKMVGLATALDQQRPLLFRYPTEKDPCIAMRTPEGKLVAYSQVCTHLSCAVIYDQSEDKLLCPCHNGSFNILQGEPISGPPTRRLPRILIEQRGNQLFATGVEV